jgi:hypothetical protein
MKKLTRNIILGIALFLLVLAFIPGQGSKAADQKKTAEAVYSCTKDADCPSCIGSGLNVSMESKCVSGTCVLPQTCLKWDCGNQVNCKSIRNTVLDNIVSWLSQNPWIVAAIIVLIGLLIYFRK